MTPGYRFMQIRFVPLATVVAVLLLYPSAAGAQHLPLTTEAADSVFSLAARVSAADGGKLWGVKLYGPMLVVDPDSRMVIADREAASLVPEDGLFVGVLPDQIGIANTAVDWHGLRWTMLRWPLPEDRFDRTALVAHEMWHRVQSDIGLPSASPPNLHLGTRDGRVWMRLEWRALAAALESEGDAQQRAVLDALTFRKQRLSIFPSAYAEERALLMHEGLAEYTGYVLAGSSSAESRRRAIAALEQAALAPTFVRSFAYPTGAAYGLLLDTFRPRWRDGLSPEDDMADQLALAVGEKVAIIDEDGHPYEPAELADERRDNENVLKDLLDRYDGTTLIEEEDTLANRRAERLTTMRRKFISGPTLTLDFVHMNVQFDPGEVDALDDVGNVYRSLRLTDEWGVLRATDGALITADWGAVILPAPDGEIQGTIEGEGYTLELVSGWTLMPGARAGDYHLTRTTEEPAPVRARVSE